MFSDKELSGQLRSFGAPLSGIVHLNRKDSPEHIPYLDLRPASQSKPPVADAVVEVEHRPVLYVVRGPLADSETRRRCHILAQRDQAEYLGVVEPGRMNIVPVGFGDTREPVAVNITDESAPLTVSKLAFNMGAEQQHKHGFHDRLYRLLKSTNEQIIRGAGLCPEAALSWVGRALLFRFLIDRKIIDESHLPHICGAPSLADCFASQSVAFQTSAWLDNTFNGDLLPFPVGSKTALRKAAKSQQARLWDELTKILWRTDPVGQISFGWDTLDFGHIPVGLLSQIYEAHAHQFESAGARRDSVHYTPRAIAEYMVEEALYGLAVSDRAKILDPAVGAGVFLVAAFRTLVRERWKRTGVRPARSEIRDILYRQLRGFDINNVALRLAALALYLTALELDPEPQPLEALVFENLQSLVLHDVSVKRDASGQSSFPALGSLGKHVDPEHSGAYDVVVGNPPWTAWKRTKDLPKSVFAKRVAEAEEVVRAVVARKLDQDAADQYEMIDLLPDLPFCWRSLDWLKQDGRLALALHARFLFKQSEAGVRARTMLMRAMRVTGIFNGAALRLTEVWPEISAPFCLIFARNTAPSKTDAFHFVSPALDERLNQRGTIRIDAADAHLLKVAEVLSHPSLLKTRFRGTELDAAIMEKFSAKGFPDLATYWRSTLKLKYGHGFQVGGPARPKTPAGDIYGLPLVTVDETKPVIASRTLEKMNHTELLSPRDSNIYQAPLVLVRETSPAGGGVRAHLACDSVAYNESFIGFSAKGHPDSFELAKYLFLIFNSKLLDYVALMRSSKFGVERDVCLLEDIVGLPIRPFDSLDNLHEMDVVCNLLCYPPKGTSAENIGQLVDEYVMHEIYGMTYRERRTITDTLSVSAPHADARQAAQRRPTGRDISSFLDELEKQLNAFWRPLGSPVHVEVVRDHKSEPWLFIRIQTSVRSTAAVAAAVLREFVDEANAYGSTLVFCREHNSLLVGILAQYRYWTRTRARLLALDVRRLHEDSLLGGGQ